MHSSRECQIHSRLCRWHAPSYLFKDLALNPSQLLSGLQIPLITNKEAGTVLNEGKTETNGIPPFSNAAYNLIKILDRKLC